MRERLSFMYLSLGGRIRRRDYWLYFVLPAFVLLMLRLGLELEGGAFEPIVVLVILWPAIVVQVKRWHDLDFSGWWVLVNFVPVVGPLIALLVNGFAPGTRGENRYGDEPAAGE